MHIAICDDSPADRDYLSSLLSAWASSRQVSLVSVPFPSAESFLFQMADRPWDVLLLDIEMGGQDGVSMARQLRKVNETIQIIFITGYSEYISQGYDVAALHYLIKPVGKEKLFPVLDRALSAISKTSRALTLALANEVVRVPLYSIKYIDVQSNYVTVHGKENYTLKKPLKIIAASLDERFYRISRSVIVNIRSVTRVTKTDVYLEDGTRLPLPRGSYEGINRAIINME